MFLKAFKIQRRLYPHENVAVNEKFFSTSYYLLRSPLLTAELPGNFRAASASDEKPHLLQCRHFMFECFQDDPLVHAV